MKYIVTVLLIFLVVPFVFAQETIDLQFVVITNDGSDFVVKIQCQKGSGTWDRLGITNFAFYYNNSGINNPTIQTAHNFSGGFYNTMTITDNTTWISIGIVFTGSNGQGTLVPSGSWTDVADIHFDVVSSAQSSGLTWRSDGAFSAWDDNGSTVITAGTFTNLDVSLPVQMSGIIAMSSQEKGVTISWQTQSETNTAGFHVWRSKEETGEYRQVTTSLIPGQGNSSTAQTYSFNDRNVEDGILYWYKIQELAMDGGSAYYGPVSVVGINPVPKTYDLSQNYPNPFNPETRFHYQLPEETEVAIIIYSLLGQKIRDVVNEKQPAGYYQKIWDGKDTFGHSVPSGIYFLQINAGSFKAIRKMALMR